MSEKEADLEVFPNAPSSVPFPREVEAPTEAGSSPSPAEALLITYTARRLALLRLLVAPPQTLRPFCIIFTLSSKPWTSVMTTWFCYFMDICPSTSLVFLSSSMTRVEKVFWSFDGRVLIELCGP